MTAQRSTRAAAPSMPQSTVAASLMQRKCACGQHTPAAETCAACNTRNAGLRVGAPDDRFERQADRIADQVMRRPLDEPGKLADAEPALQRKISRAGHGAGGPSPVPRMVGSPGRALDPTTREFMESRFGHDFSSVRVHSGAGAAASARSVSARAFTVGQHIVFGRNQYSPGTDRGRRLLAHELAHTLQQGHGNDRLQRTVEVRPTSAIHEVLGHFNNLCGNGNFTVQGTNRITSACSATTPAGCECLCDVTTNQDRPIVIDVYNVANNPRHNQTLHDGTVAPVVPWPSEGPRTSNVQSNPVVHLPSASGSAIRFGAFQADGTPIPTDSTRILAHELCGHARFGYSYEGETGDRPRHDTTIAIENRICAPPARGYDSSTRQGESYHQLQGDPNLVFRLRNPSGGVGLHYEQVP